MPPPLPLCCAPATFTLLHPPTPPHPYTPPCPLQINGFISRAEVTGDEAAATAVSHFFALALRHHSFSTGWWAPPPHNLSLAAAWLLLLCWLTAAAAATTPLSTGGLVSCMSAGGCWLVLWRWPAAAVTAPPNAAGGTFLLHRQGSGSCCGEALAPAGSLALVLGARLCFRLKTNTTLPLAPLGNPPPPTHTPAGGSNWYEHWYAEDVLGDAINNVRGGVEVGVEGFPFARGPLFGGPWGLLAAGGRGHLVTRDREVQACGRKAPEAVRQWIVRRVCVPCCRQQCEGGGRGRAAHQAVVRGEAARWQGVHPSGCMS